MLKINEFEERSCLLVEQLRAEQVATAPKSTTSPESVPKNLMPSDKRWLEATQLCLFTEDELPMSLKECLDRQLFHEQDTILLLLTGQRLKQE
jgi:hypothetical protein